MSIHERLPCVVMDDSLLRIFIDDSELPSSVEHRWTETTWEGSGRVFSIPLHWHRYHDEHLEVLEGDLDIYYDGYWHRTTPLDGKIVVKRTEVHGVKCVPGKRMVLKEAVDPVGDYKEAFFRNLSQANESAPWKVLGTFYDWDTYPSIGGGWSPRWVDWLFITLVGGFVKLITPKVATDTKIE